MRSSFVLFTSSALGVRFNYRYGIIRIRNKGETTIKEFRKPGKVDGEAVSLSKKNSEGDFVFFTGGTKINRKASGRTAVLSLIREKRRPIPLATLYDRAKAASGDKGFDPAFVRGGVYNDTGAKGAIYFLLSRDSEGNFRAVRNIPYPDENFSKKPFKAGDIVVRAETKPASLPGPTPTVGG